MSESSFAAVLARLARENGSRAAVTHHGTTLSRARLLRRVEATAARLAEHGVRADSVVATCLPNSIDNITLTLAIWWLGATPLPLAANLPEPELRAFLALARPTLVIGSGSSAAGAAPSVPVERVRGSAGAASNAVARCGAPARRWKIVTSGGSTGRPKLIVSREPATEQVIDPYADTLRLEPSDTVLITAPLSHNAPFTIAFIGLLRGAHVVIMDRFDPAATVELVAAHEVTWLYLVPTMMRRIRRLSPEQRETEAMSSLRIAYHMSAPCPPWLKQEWIDWLGGERVHELYSGSEMHAATSISGTDWERHRGSVGRASIGEVAVHRKDGRPCGVGEVGTVWLRRGPDAQPPYEYLGADVPVRAGGWSSLGDLGYLDADGYLYLTDRESSMLIVGGVNVYPAEIEEALADHPAVRSCCVIGLPDDDLGERPHAIVELAEPVTDEVLLVFLRARLAPYKLPRSFERVDHPLVDDAGKVRRAAMREERRRRYPNSQS